MSEPTAPAPEGTAKKKRALSAFERERRSRVNEQVLRLYRQGLTFEQIRHMLVVRAFCTACKTEHGKPLEVHTLPKLEPCPSCGGTSFRKTKWAHRRQPQKIYARYVDGAPKREAEEYLYEFEDRHRALIKALWAQSEPHYEWAEVEVIVVVDGVRKREKQRVPVVKPADVAAANAISEFSAKILKVRAPIHTAERQLTGAIPLEELDELRKRVEETSGCKESASEPKSKPETSEPDSSPDASETSSASAVYSTSP